MGMGARIKASTYASYRVNQPYSCLLRSLLIAATDGVDKKNEDVDEDQEELFDPEATFLLIDRWPYFLISHDSEFKGHWETMIICLVLFQAMQAPFETAFADLGMGLAWDVFMMVIFIIDFLHNFFTTYSDRNGNTVINGEEVRIKGV